MSKYSQIFEILRIGTSTYKSLEGHNSTSNRKDEESSLVHVEFEMPRCMQRAVVVLKCVYICENAAEKREKAVKTMRVDKVVLASGTQPWLMLIITWVSC